MRGYRQHFSCGLVPAWLSGVTDRHPGPASLLDRSLESWVLCIQCVTVFGEDGAPAKPSFARPIESRTDPERRAVTGRDVRTIRVEHAWEEKPGALVCDQRIISLAAPG